MLSVVHLDPPQAGADLRAPGRAALEVLSRRPGFVRGSLARATDDADAWLLVTEWESVGDYRRALGNAQVKLTATPLFHLADGAVSAFEQLTTATPGALADHATDLATDGV